MFESWILLALAAPVADPPADRAELEQQDMRRARDGNIAIQEELDLARRAATVEAYDLFIARHPEHPLAEVARQERRQLLDRQKQPRG